MMTPSSIPWSKGAGLLGETDYSLAERAANGDPEAFAHIVRTHQAYVARLAQRLLGWSPDVEDVVQDVFAKAWQHRRQLREPEKLRGWLTMITVNTARSRLRKIKLKRVLMMNMHAQQDGRQVESFVPSGEVEREELGRQVREAMSKLAQRDKEVLVLRYMQQMTVSEVAQALGLSHSATTGRLHRARNRLAECLPRELQP